MPEPRYIIDGAGNPVAVVLDIDAYQKLLDAVPPEIQDAYAVSMDAIDLSLQNAPLDDEPLTPEEEEALAEPLEQLRAKGEVLTHDELLQELFGQDQ